MKKYLKEQIKQFKYGEKNNMDNITKNTSIKEGVEILNNHGINTKLHGWEIIIGMLLYDCDYIEVHDYGHNAYFIKRMEE